MVLNYCHVLLPADGRTLVNFLQHWACQATALNPRLKKKASRFKVTVEPLTPPPAAREQPGVSDAWYFTALGGKHAGNSTTMEDVSSKQQKPGTGTDNLAQEAKEAAAAETAITAAVSAGVEKQAARLLLEMFPQAAAEDHSLPITTCTPSAPLLTAPQPAPAPPAAAAVAGPSALTCQRQQPPCQGATPSAETSSASLGRNWSISRQPPYDKQLLTTLAGMSASTGPSQSQNLISSTPSASPSSLTSAAAFMAGTASNPSHNALETRALSAACVLPADASVQKEEPKQQQQQQQQQEKEEEAMVTAAITKGVPLVTDYRTDPLHPTRVLKPGWLAAVKRVAAAARVISRDKRVMTDILAARAAVRAEIRVSAQTAVVASHDCETAPAACEPAATAAADAGSAAVPSVAAGGGGDVMQAMSKGARSTPTDPKALTTVLLHIPPGDLDHLKVGHDLIPLTAVLWELLARKLPVSPAVHRTSTVKNRSARL